MLRYISSRLLITVPMLLLVAVVTFFAFKLIPGDPARMFAGEDAPLERVEAIRSELGLDRPILNQFASYMGRLLHGDLGRSVSSRRPVIEEIRSRFGRTFKLALTAIAIATATGIALGTLAALHKGTWIDAAVSLISLLGISVPSFWLGLLLMQLFSVKLGLLPAAGYGGWQNFLMPGLTLSVFSIAFITRMTRSSLLEVLENDYIRTAKAKGLSRAAVITAHAMRNALLPIIIIVGMRFGYMIGGAVIVEEVFAWPGLGRLLILSVGQRDIPVVQGLLLVFAATFILINLAVDTLYATLDPKLRHQL